MTDRERDPERDEAQADGSGEPTGEGARADERRPALSEEIARKWDPARLVKMMSGRGGPGQALDLTTRERFERKLGVDLGGVRVYRGELAEQVTRQHRAEAVTVGGTGMIFMGSTPDRSPATAAGQALLAHELTHVAQSQRGVYRSAPGERPPLATDSNEREAEVVEAHEHAEASGVAGQQIGPVFNTEQMKSDLIERVTSRVVELIYDEERIATLRNRGGS